MLTQTSKRRQSFEEDIGKTRKRLEEVCIVVVLKLCSTCTLGLPHTNFRMTRLVCIHFSNFQNYCSIIDRKSVWDRLASTISAKMDNSLISLNLVHVNKSRLKVYTFISIVILEMFTMFLSSWAISLAAVKGRREW